MEPKADPHETDSVGLMEGLSLPVYVTSGVLEETSNVFKRSPFLGLISGFLEVSNKFVEVTVSLFCEGSKLTTLERIVILTFQSCQLFR